MAGRSAQQVGVVAGPAVQKQVNYEALQAQARARHLTILGGFHPEPEDSDLRGAGTLLLLGPDEPVFWAAFTHSPEYKDAAPDPMDRWSARVIGDWARTIRARALFPSDGPPYLPFFGWATRTDRIHVSPIRLLVHDTAGLFVSFRGALALPEQIDLPAAPSAPCLSCTDQPCRTTCPVDAFDGTGYDVAACKSFLGEPAGRDCMTLGCAARRSCPVSQAYPRLPEQSAFHMTAFKG
jgi:hypothetical protein